MMRSTVGRTFRLRMGSSSMIRACWSMWAHRNRHASSLAAQSTGCPGLAASHGKRKDTLGRSPAAARCWADTIECASSSAASHGVESDVVRRDEVVHDRRPFPTDAMQQVVPTYRVRRAAHYMTAMGLWRPPTTPEIRGPLPLATCNACMSCSDCFPDVPQ